MWQLPLGGGGRGGDDRAGGQSQTPAAASPGGQGPAGQSPAAGQTPGSQGPAAPSPAAQVPAGPPTFIKQTGPNLDDYDPIRNDCKNPVPEEKPLADFQSSVTTSATDWKHELKPGQVQIGYRMKNPLPDVPPYYVSVVVKPQHEVDASGRSTAVTDNRQLGFVAKARDVYEGDELEWKYVVYPDDFSMELGGKKVQAPPLAQDPGGWTVVFRHAVSDTEHKSVGCLGFDSGPQKG